jgi:hypothetical protein
MNNKGKLTIELEDLMRNLVEKEAKWNLHLCTCVKPRPNGLLPICCANIIGPFQAAKDKFDNAREKLDRERQ